MSKTEFQVLDTIHPKNIYPPINITPVLWHRGDFCGIEHIEVRWPDELRLFYDKQLFEQMKAKLKEYDNCIQRLCRLVPEDRWDEVYDEITKMGIDYVGADDV
jgi:hypothetical protein